MKSRCPGCGALVVEFPEYSKVCYGCIAEQKKAEAKEMREFLTRPKDTNE
mgnify:CR=1 FL=1